MEPTKPPTASKSFYRDTECDDILKDCDNATNDNNEGTPWSRPPYTYIFYTAISIVAMLLMCMACCCYVKFKPPHDDEHKKNKNKDRVIHEHKFNITGQSKDGKHPRTVSVTVDGDRGRTEMVNISNEHSTPPHEHYGLNMNDQTTMSQTTQTSDGDVLKGAYGGHITAPGDDETFPIDRTR